MNPITSIPFSRRDELANVANVRLSRSAARGHTEVAPARFAFAFATPCFLLKTPFQVEGVRSRMRRKSRGFSRVALAQPLRYEGVMSKVNPMRIEVSGDDSISRQARIYAEYRVFAALSQAAGTDRVRSASMVLHRTNSTRDCDSVVCTVSVELDNGELARIKVSGDHPYAAINRAVDRLRLTAWPMRREASQRVGVGSE